MLISVKATTRIDVPFVVIHADRYTLHHAALYTRHLIVHVLTKRFGGSVLYTCRPTRTIHNGQIIADGQLEQLDEPLGDEWV